MQTMVLSMQTHTALCIEAASCQARFNFLVRLKSIYRLKLIFAIFANQVAVFVYVNDDEVGCLQTNICLDN